MEVDSSWKNKYVLINRGSEGSCGKVIYLTENEIEILETYIKLLNEKAKDIPYAPGLDLVKWEQIENDHYIQTEFQYQVEDGKYNEDEINRFVEDNIWAI